MKLSCDAVREERNCILGAGRGVLLGDFIKLAKKKRKPRSSASFGRRHSGSALCVVCWEFGGVLVLDWGVLGHGFSGDTSKHVMLSSFFFLFLTYVLGKG